MVRIFKGIGIAIGGTIGAVAIGLLLWTVLYLAIPNVKDNTDKIFKWNDYAVEDTVEDETDKENNEDTEEETIIPEEETNEEETEQLQVVLNENMTSVKIIG